MSNYRITFKVAGKIVTAAKIREVELERYHHVFKVFNKKNISITLKGRPLTTAELLHLPLADAKIALAETREAIGKAKTLSLFAPEIEKSNKMWREIAENSQANQNLQAGIVEVETHNISLLQFMLFNQLLFKKNNLYLPSIIHPEHYYFDANRKGVQTIIETFGMYQEPSYLDLRPSNASVAPIKPDPNVDLIMIGKTFLKSLNIDTKLIGMHQLTQTDAGMRVKLGVFLPEAAPKEIVTGHQWHLMIEFNNGLQIAANQHPNAVQKILLQQAIKHLKNKQQSN
ncbi:MAG: hypothetical protein ABF664_11700 [Liquorilactobacillus satsumensis]